MSEYLKSHLKVHPTGFINNNNITFAHCFKRDEKKVIPSSQ